ncbi:hypothetical protein PHLGIDRAFT_37268 [Phlebiopsis gigantea 11061_1 CR5-6]|uniref:DUF6534 domain-containing protein n=1 Tax=Phlebiopsis gigantea (strain 11061_1 CR5-6) TaxID=745531 RepID=A0A0C3RT51_PHLG1|nr:hypothetical protein PHLGIDRAFT_37268 [Phlebiopsis gigantea 11061_1 CR5-6]
MASNSTTSVDPALIASCLESQAILSQMHRGNTIGVAYLGVAISAMMYGVTCCQTFYYYRSAKGQSDPWYLKTLVAILLVLDSTHEALIIEALYHYLIIHYADPVALLTNTWSLEAEVMVNAAIAFLVECFLVYRLWRLSSNFLVAGVCGLFTVAHLVMNLVYPIRALFYPELATALVKLKSTGSSGLAVAVVADVSIAAAMSFYLHRSRTGFRRSDDMITKVMALTITTGAVTTCFVIGNLIAYLAAPAALYVLFFNFMLGKLYINTLLTSLNTRNAIRAAQTQGSSTGGLVNSIPLSGLRSAATGPSPVNIVVNKSVERDQSMSDRLEAKEFAL